MSDFDRIIRNCINDYYKHSKFNSDYVMDKTEVKKIVVNLLDPHEYSDYYFNAFWL